MINPFAEKVAFLPLPPEFALRIREGGGERILLSLNPNHWLQRRKVDGGLIQA